jgi:hypothetical protein
MSKQDPSSRALHLACFAVTFLACGQSIHAQDTTALAAGSKRSALSSSEPNPKVQPGLVRWHPSLEAACAAAKNSGKPVLLFQMMGRLDEQFC